MRRAPKRPRRARSSFELMVTRVMRDMTAARGSDIVPTHELMAALGAEVFGRAVQDGLLRVGVTGTWLRAEPDPGAVLVMNRAMRGGGDE